MRHRWLLWALAAVSLLAIACSGTIASQIVSTSCPRPTPFHSPTATPTPDDLYLMASDIVVYPGPELYSGDLLTFDVTPRNVGQIAPQEIEVEVDLRTPAGDESVARTTTGYPTFDRVPRARMVWAWDTTGLSGTQQLVVTLDPDDTLQEGDENQANNAAVITVNLLPAAELPPAEAHATWVSTTTN